MMDYLSVLSLTGKFLFFSRVSSMAAANSKKGEDVDVPAADLMAAITTSTTTLSAQQVTFQAAQDRNMVDKEARLMAASVAAKSAAPAMSQGSHMF